MITRLFRHLFAPLVRQRFPDSALDAIQHAVTQSERLHDAELCFAVEGRLSIDHLLSGRSARQRAEEVFSNLRVWDTERNTGVLIYLLLAERAIEIIADRGVALRVPEAEWASVHAAIASAFARRDWQGGALLGVEAAHTVLARFVPVTGQEQIDELPDRPVLL
ncbi:MULTISPECIES: TPM domain-containing protein [Silvimonas]|uniref:TPM domain-containing protein n=1 Tax=Silvimonas TaxID=300264 RepID=UPI0024B3C88B|nr:MULTISPECIES: TPM domain-containing protein [Silvimonas]MDR3426245.1 TPM domain-containing protein [Silvimonas sp.]